MGTPALDLSGRVFGRLKVIERCSENTKAGKSRWLVFCECGKEKVVVGSSLISGLVVSCGCWSRDQAKKNIKDLTGHKFGGVFVVRQMDKRKDRRVIWECLCSCGNLFYATGNKIKSGHTISCGCSPHSPRFRDETGNKFNKWTVIKVSSILKGRVIYLCQCDCGNYSEVLSSNLRSGLSSQCRQCGDNTGKTKTHGMSDSSLYACWMVRKRNDKKQMLDHLWTLSMEVALRELFTGCVLCGSKDKLCIDHLLPLSLGYGLAPDNAVILCQSCNSSKSNKYITELAPEIRRKLIDSSCTFQDYWERVSY